MRPCCCDGMDPKAAMSLVLMTGTMSPHVVGPSVIKMKRWPFKTERTLTFYVVGEYSLVEQHFYSHFKHDDIKTSCSQTQYY